MRELQERTPDRLPRSLEKPSEHLSASTVWGNLFFVNIVEFPDFQTPPSDELSDPNLTPLDQEAKSPCCDLRGVRPFTVQLCDLQNILMLPNAPPSRYVSAGGSCQLIITYDLAIAFVAACWARSKVLVKRSGLPS